MSQFKTLAANLMKAAKDGNTVYIAGGLFGPQELKEAAIYLDPDLAPRSKPARQEDGDISICRHCGQEIQLLSRAWLDRGGNRSCTTYHDKTKGEFVHPRTFHKSV